MTSDEQHPHIVRLFPHGAVILLTESLILYQPIETLRLVMWFRLVQLKSKTPGTWKLAVRPEIRQWLSDILDLHGEMEQSTFSDSKKDDFAKIYTEISLLFGMSSARETFIVPAIEYDHPARDTPIITPFSLGTPQQYCEWRVNDGVADADHGTIQEVDETLMRWFAEWAMVDGCRQYRKMIIIPGRPPANCISSPSAQGKHFTAEQKEKLREAALSKQDEEFNVRTEWWRRRYGHVDTKKVESYLQANSVPPLDQLMNMEKDRRSRVQDKISRMKDEMDIDS